MPRAGGDWGKCDPDNSKNRRTRCSLLVRSKLTTLVIDTGADFREQMTTNDVKNIDSVLYTHAHGDHVNGMDDLRTYSMRQKGPIPVYANKSCLKILKLKFPHLFQQISKFYPVVVTENLIEPSKNYRIKDIDFSTHSLIHGEEETTGFRFGNTLYSVDMYDIDVNVRGNNNDIKTWIVDAGGYLSEGNPVHASFEKVYELNKSIIKAERIILNVLPMYIDYIEASENLPAGFELAYDGLELCA